MAQKDVSDLTFNMFMEMSKPKCDFGFRRGALFHLDSDSFPRQIGKLSESLIKAGVNIHNIDFFKCAQCSPAERRLFNCEAPQVDCPSRKKFKRGNCD